MALEPSTEQIGTSGRAAEFYAGIGLVRLALERAGWSIVYANDNSRFKRAMYRTNFPEGQLDSRDVREVKGCDVPTVELATASFPCIDLSLAGKRRGLAGEHSGLFWEFSRVIDEMGSRRPRYVLIENVPSFVTSKQGADLRAAVLRLNGLGYTCDFLVADAKSHVPQSRKRLFIVGLLGGIEADSVEQSDSTLRTPALTRFIACNPDLRLITLPIPPPPAAPQSLASVVERLGESDERWWDAGRKRRFEASLSDLNRERLGRMMDRSTPKWATTYRRTRQGQSVWEIRSDEVAGCLRTSSGGSSKQALVEAARGQVRVRWMTPLEYARLQGAGNYRVPESVTESQALSGFGDAVCVPAMEWVVRSCLNPIASSPAQA